MSLWKLMSLSSEKESIIEANRSTANGYLAGTSVDQDEYLWCPWKIGKKCICYENQGVVGINSGLFSCENIF